MGWSAGRTHGLIRWRSSGIWTISITPSAAPPLPPVLRSSAAYGRAGRELTGQRVDIIIVQGASNDWAHNIPVGETDSRDPETAMGALNRILDTLEQAHPEATLICFTPWISNGAKNDLGLETTAYHDAMLTLCRERNILCYDAADARQNGIHMDDGTFRTEYCLTPTDRWHMNPKGQAMFAPVFSAWLQKTLYGEAEPADRFARPDIRLRTSAGGGGAAGAGGDHAGNLRYAVFSCESGDRG